MAEFLPELLGTKLSKRSSFQLSDLLDMLDGQGAIITDTDEIEQMVMKLDTDLMVVPDELYCLILRRGIHIHSCILYCSKLKAEEGFVRFMREAGYFEKAAEQLKGEHEHDYKLMLEAIDASDFWKVDFQAIQEIGQ